MLIRSQNKEILMNLENLSGIEITGKATEKCIVARDSNTAYLLGTYSDPQKALRVLDMIQEAYADAEFAKSTIDMMPAMVSSETPETKKDREIADAVMETYKQTTYFQMPQDDEMEI